MSITYSRFRKSSTVQTAAVTSQPCRTVFCIQRRYALTTRRISGQSAAKAIAKLIGYVHEHRQRINYGAQRLLIVGVLVLVWPVYHCLGADVPTSLRAQTVIERLTLPLQRALQARGLRYGAPIFLRIFKESKELEMWVQGDTRFHLFRTYKICAYSGDLGPKQQEGDLQSPEGFYVVTPERMNPESNYHLSFDLGYPNTYDEAYGRTGNALMIHGNCVSAGCYALTDADVEEIYALADAALRRGQPAFAVHVFPFRMSRKNLQRFRHVAWLPFWLNLKEGYDLFVKLRRPPRVMVQDQRYIFTSPGPDGIP